MIKKLSTFFSIISIIGFNALASEPTTITIESFKPAQSQIIPAEIYGQFAEHLGSCIYGGIWVGEDSPIPNTNGYRNDVLKALKELNVPVIRWPGGCFADEYHWTDGIGPRENRPVMVNSNWGGTVEDNSFGTHEFFDLCELIGCEPYLSGNVGSGTVEELAKWVEYITAKNGPMAELRKKNGREKPWKLKYIGVGNESWGCGGNFTPEAYADAYRRYQTYCRNFDGNKLYKVASGANGNDYNWNDVLMKNARHHMDGLSVHYYTTPGQWDSDKGSAIDFSNDDYYWTLGKTLEMEELITKHDSVMTKYDPEKKIALLVDEWGTWWNQEPGSIPGHLYQQNSMRDAIVAALNFNIFHNHTDRVKMANIAQLANVLQAMVLTKDRQMVLTPTYYAFKLYAPHQNAVRIPIEVATGTLPPVRGYSEIPILSATATAKDGYLNITLVNTDLEKTNDVKIRLPESVIKNNISGEILTSDKITDYNDFGKPEKIRIAPFTSFKTEDKAILVNLPSKSIVNIKVKI